LYGFFVLRHGHLQNAKRGRLEKTPLSPQKKTYSNCRGFFV
jgi:hypothetical protein